MKIIKFGGYTCPMCRKLDAILDLKGYNTKIDVKVTLDDTDGDWSREYDIHTLPTLIKLDDEGNEVARLQGLVSLNRIKDFFEVE